VRWRRRIRAAVFAAAGATLAAIVSFAACDALFPFPVDALERRPRTVVVRDAAGGVLLRRTGSDGQWRDPVPLAATGPWLAKATIACEDQRFEHHGGIDLVAALRATGQNLAATEVVSGASTITMQVARMVEPRRRTLWAKAVQAFRAVQLEGLMDKDRILEHYLNIAPYGGNIRGVEEAARAYYGRRAADLTLDEAALLAGVPMSPRTLRPDRFPEAAARRRDRVLARMLEEGFITRAQHDAARLAPVAARRPEPGGESPAVAWHVLSRRPGGGRTTIDPLVQRRLGDALRQGLATMPQGTRGAGVVIDIERASIVAMVSMGEGAATEVNGAAAWRSPGSALKPFIYAAAFEAGHLAPESMLLDEPMARGGWDPSNFSRTFAGPVEAGDALRRSLNIPAISLVEALGSGSVAAMLDACGVQLSEDAVRRAGLSIAVGGAELTLLDLTDAYATLGRDGVHRRATIFPDQEPMASRAMRAEVAQAVSDVLSSRRRPAAGVEGSAPWFCWKTGTSSGRRDAWAVGHNRRVAAGVWMGDFSGRGRVEYLGAESAEPVLAACLTDAAMALAGGDPPAPPPLTVRDPLPQTRRAGAGIRILEPEPGAVMVAVGGGATVRARSSEPGTWFHNGVKVESAERIRCTPGEHELRCVAEGGRADAVRFMVR
jgi:penicillin-binding protein 1C